MKITASVTKSLYQDRGLCYLHLPIFFLYMHSPVQVQKKKGCCDHCFLQRIGPITTVRLCILQDYSSVRIYWFQYELQTTHHLV